MVIKIFIWGMILAPLAIILELLLIWLLNPTTYPLSLLREMPQDGFIRVILAATLVPALVEEYLKYSVVKLKVLKHSEFDEPIDAMLYCIIAGLGFAAIENLLVIFKVSSPDLAETLSTIGFRFVGATLVHALASGIVGYWLALGILYTKHRKKLISIGLLIAIFIHSCYNYLIITAFDQISVNKEIMLLSITAVLLITSALLVSLYFRKLKKQQAICKINEQ